MRLAKRKTKHTPKVWRINASYLADKMESVFYQGNNDEKVHDFIKMVTADPALLEQLMATMKSA